MGGVGGAVDSNGEAATSGGLASALHERERRRGSTASVVTSGSSAGGAVAAVSTGEPEEAVLVGVLLKLLRRDRHFRTACRSFLIVVWGAQAQWWTVDGSEMIAISK